jgi:hypothetical protein
MIISNDLSLLKTKVNLVNASSVMSDAGMILPSGYDLAVVNENKVLYGFVSKNFALVQPNDVIDTFGEQFDKRNLKFDISGRIDNRGNYQVRFDFPLMQAIERKLNDMVNAMLGINGGLAGGQSFGMIQMFKRLVCLNGMTRVSKATELFAKVRNTKNTHLNKLGIDFDLLIPIIEEWVSNSDLAFEFQEKMQNQELKQEHILPFFYEATKGTFFPSTKFQDAYDRMKVEASDLGYTAMNRYLAYAGLNYILEHDSMSMDIIKTNNADSIISSKTIDMNIGMAVKNFNALVKAENERIELYKVTHEGKLPNGRKPVLELV